MQNTAEKSSFIKFIEPATILAIITAVLYFWGFAYFSAFCEQLGIRFHGIEVPFPAYLLVGWMNIFYLTMVLCVALCWYEQATWLLTKILKGALLFLFKRFRGFFEGLFNMPFLRWLEKTDEPKNELLKYGLILTIIIGCAVYGTKNLVKQGQAFADTPLETKQTIILYGTNHQPIEGNFIYLRDYGSALIVGELSKSQEVSSIRIFKAGSYSSYALELK